MFSLEAWYTDEERNLREDYKWTHLVYQVQGMQVLSPAASAPNSDCLIDTGLDKQKVFAL